MDGIGSKFALFAFLGAAVIVGCGYTKIATDSRPPSIPYFPPDLAIIYVVNDVTFNSFDGYIEKNIGTRLVRIPFILSSPDKARIYDKLKIMDFTLYGGSLYSASVGARGLRVRCGGREVVMSYVKQGVANNEEASAKLKGLQGVLDDVLLNNGYYLTLPPYEGLPRL